MNQLKKVFKSNLVRWVKDVTFEKDKLCGVCQARKQVANTHPYKNFMSTSRPLELLHIDLLGPTTYKSIGGNLYCLMIGMTIQGILGCSFFKKSQKQWRFSRSLPREHKKFGNPIVKIRSENG